MTTTTQGPHPSQVETIRGVLKYYKATSYITGTFLLLLVIEVIVRWVLGYDLIAGGPQGFLHFYERGLNGMGLPDTGLNLSTAVLIVHGWLYVAYLFGDFRLWTLMRWSFLRFLIIALGGIVPLLSFFTENHFAKVAEADLKKVA